MRCEHGRWLQDGCDLCQKTTLTLRDQFAMAALQGLLANTDTGGFTNYSIEAIPPIAYEYADSMLKQRERVE